MVNEQLVIFKEWQTLIAGVLAFFGGGFAILAVYVSNKYQTNRLPSEHDQKKCAVKNIIIADTRNTDLRIQEYVEYFDEIIFSYERGQVHPIDAPTEIVIGASFVNAWTIAEYLDGRQLTKLFEYAHRLYNAQNLIRKLRERILNDPNALHIDALEECQVACKESLQSGSNLRDLVLPENGDVNA